MIYKCFAFVTRFCLFSPDCHAIVVAIPRKNTRDEVKTISLCVMLDRLAVVPKLSHALWLGLFPDAVIFARNFGSGYGTDGGEACPKTRSMSTHSVLALSNPFPLPTSRKK